MNDELHSQSGAYAVHALSTDEGRAFERHLDTCPACVAEVRALRETTARLAFSASRPPPPELRARVLAAAQASRAETRAVRHATPRPVRQRRRSGWLTGVAAVGVAASAVLGVTTFQARRDLDAAMAVLTAPDVQAVSQPITGGGTGSLVVSRGRGRLVFTASGLPSPPSSRSYELWLMGPAGVRPAGLLRSGVPTLASPESGDDRVGLTVEPAGGSQQPTTQPIMLADLPAA